MATKKYLLVIGGPTASGKTRLAIQLARKYTTEILSADSRQFFREMNIGTARPSDTELAAAPHHFVGHRSITEAYSVGAFERDALALLDDLFQLHDVVILAGGSGLYLQAVCQGLDHFPEVSDTVRRSVERDYREKGLPALQAELQETDPAYFAEVDQHNPHRLIRALGVIRQSGRPFSFFRKENQPPRPFTPVYLALQHSRAELYERINRRVDAMVDAGLEAEARRLYPFRHHIALQTVGYQEWFDHFDGTISREEAITLIKQHTRNYAKRQLTWMRRDGFWKHFTPAETDNLLPAYLEQALPTGWQWRFERQDGVLCLRENETELGRATLQWHKENQRPDKRILHIRKITGTAVAQKWLLHESIRRAENRPAQIIGNQEVMTHLQISGIPYTIEPLTTSEIGTYRMTIAGN